MKKEDLKAAIKANFENNEFATAMGLNKDLFQEYETVAGKRSAAAIVSYYRKKAGEAPAETDTITSEEVGKIEDILPAEEKKEEKVEVPARRFAIDEVFNLNDIKELLESENPALSLYCITKEEFEQVSDEEERIKTTMYVNPDGLGWEKASEVSKLLKDNDLKSFRKPGSFYNSNVGLPVGEVYVKYTIYKVGDALLRFAFRTNTSAIRCATCL